MKKGSARSASDRGVMERIVQAADAWIVRANKFLANFPDPGGSATQHYVDQTQEISVPLLQEGNIVRQRVGSYGPINATYRQQIDTLFESVAARANSIVSAPRASGGRMKKGGFEVEDYGEWERENLQRVMRPADAWIVKANRFLENFPAQTGPATDAYRAQLAEAYRPLHDEGDNIAYRLGQNSRVNPTYKQQFQDVLHKVVMRNAAILGVLGGRKKGGAISDEEILRGYSQLFARDVDAWIAKADQFLKDFPTPTGTITLAYRLQATHAYFDLLDGSDLILSRIDTEPPINYRHVQQFQELLEKVSQRHNEIVGAQWEQGGRRKTHRIKRIRTSTGRRTRR